MAGYRCEVCITLRESPLCARCYRDATRPSPRSDFRAYRKHIKPDEQVRRDLGRAVGAGASNQIEGPNSRRAVRAPFVFCGVVVMGRRARDAEAEDARESMVRAVGDERPQATELERQIATLAKLLPLLRAIRNAGRQTAVP